MATLRGILSVVCLLAAACGGGSSQQASPAPAPAPAAAAAGTSEVLGLTSANAIVILEPKDGAAPPPPSSPAVMDQAGYNFHPGLLLAQQGQRVEFRNSEDVLHNVRVANTDTKEVIFNIATPPFGTYAHTFEAAGYYSVTCDVHPAMSASILVTASPYTAIADAGGRFSIPGVPPGSYVATAYTDTGRRELVVTVTTGRTEITIM